MWLKRSLIPLVTMLVTLKILFKVNDEVLETLEIFQKLKVWNFHLVYWTILPPSGAWFPTALIVRFTLVLNSATFALTNWWRLLKSLVRSLTIQRIDFWRVSNSLTRFSKWVIELDDLLPRSRLLVHLTLSYKAQASCTSRPSICGHHRVDAISFVWDLIQPRLKNTNVIENFPRI